MDAVIWIVFLLGAPALLYWMWRGNRQRREVWRAWCRARGWRIEVDRDQGIDTPPGDLPGFPIETARLKRDTIDLRARGAHAERDAAAWEWRLLAKYGGKRGAFSSTGKIYNAVAMRLGTRLRAPLYLLPRPMLLLSLSGVLDQPGIDLGAFGMSEGWQCHGGDAAEARAWATRHLSAIDRTRVPDLLMLQLRDDWIVAWHLGELRPDRIEAALAWLSALSDNMARTDSGGTPVATA